MLTWRFAANNPEIHHYFRTSTWRCRSLITTSPGEVLYTCVSYRAQKRANSSEAGVSVHMFRSISIRFVPVAAAIPTTRWWRSWNCWNGESSEGSSYQKRSRWWFWPSCTEARAARGLIMRCVATVNCWLEKLNFITFFCLPSDEMIMTGGVSQTWAE